jgi:predicted transcriptional regulator
MAKIVLSVRMDEEDVRKLDEAADFLRTTRSGVVQVLLRNFLSGSVDAKRNELREAGVRRPRFGRERTHDEP